MKMNKAQLVDENIRLRAECSRLEALLSSSVDAVLTNKPAPKIHVSVPKPEAIEFDGYWHYVNAVRKWCQDQRKPVSYLTREQFDEAYAAYSDAMESAAADYVEFPHGEFAPQCNVGPLN